MDMWVSDQGSHFKNLLMRILASDFKIRHHYVTAYSPWANGTVERCMREILRAAQALLSEFKLAPMDWPQVVNLIQTTLNEAPLKRLGKNKDGSYRSPLQVMTGLTPARYPLRLIPRQEGDQELTLDRVRSLQLVNIESLQKCMEQLHKQVDERITKNRMRQIREHNKRTNIIKPQFEVGDFVLVRKPNKKGHKLSFKWKGPKRITDTINSLFYEVTGLVDVKSEKVHASRLTLYRKSDGIIEPSARLMRHIEHSEAQYEEIEELLDIGEGEHGILVQVKWLGLPDDCDFTWQPIAELYEDVPDLLNTFLDYCTKENIVEEAKRSLGVL